MPIEYVFVLDALDAGSLRWISRDLKNLWLVIFSNLIFEHAQLSKTTYDRRLRSQVQKCVIAALPGMAFNVITSGIITL